MLKDSLHQQGDQIRALSRKFGARRIRVFGSVARGEERPDSDVDFLVDLPVGYDLLGQRLALADELSDMVGRRVDLVPEHELRQPLRDKILAEAIEL
jgi:predicted nucleotidyltransferase